MPKISVIIPLYNSAKTLRRLAKSLYAQTDDDYEVVFVDDCSIDDSPEVLAEICKDRKNYRVIKTKKNGGSAGSRNFGIENTDGELICFVDSDDIISPNYLKKMRELLVENDADVVCTKYARNKLSDFEKIVNKSEVLGGEATVEALLQMKIDNGPVAKLFTRKAIGANRMPNVAVAEDLYFNYRVLKKAKTVVLNDSVLYSYIKTKDSLSTKHFSVERMGSLEAVKMIDDEEKSFYSMARLFMEAYFICEKIVLAKGTKEFEAEYKTVCDILNRDRKKILDDKRSTRRQRLIATALRFGPTLTVKLMTAKSRLR